MEEVIVFTLVLAVAIGLVVGMGTLVEEVVVCGVDGRGGVAEGLPVGVGVPVVVVDAVMGVGVGVEGGLVVGKGGPVVVPLVGVVFKDVGPEVGVPGVDGGEGVVPPVVVTVGFVPVVGEGVLDVSTIVGGVVRSVVDSVEEGTVD